MSKPFVWFLGALLLVIIADFAPKVAMIFMGLLVAGVLSINAKPVASFINDATTSISGK